MLTNSDNDFTVRLYNEKNTSSQQMQELVVKAENGDVDSIKALASLFFESDEETDRRKAFSLLVRWHWYRQRHCKGAKNV